MPITAPDFAFLQTFVRERSAIVLDPGKEYLAESRLGPVARSAGLPGIGELVARLRVDPRGDLTDKVIEAMTTNETSFFRDVHPFEALRTHILPDLIKARSNERALNLWCAASSSGQEPYTIAMLLRENFPALIEWRIRFIATDLSQEMLRRSREGIYSQLEVNRGLPAKYLVKYFEKRGSDWQVKQELRSMIEFRELNLIKPWPSMPQFDIVFIRNVLIYFDLPTKRAILGNIRKLLRSDGYLFLGGAETTLSIDENFKRSQAGTTWCYRL
ncbi:MAG: protein-glutamate O-methyltransferase CheR [Planctomycetes bacterium]|nr:protein-glutamate O-methyltransferase CheR [Planctomycetota bacterium]